MTETMTKDVLDFITIDSGIEGANEDEQIKITNRAIEAINSAKTQSNVPTEYNLRVGTRSGGCSGMQFLLGFDPELNENDRKFQAGGIDLVIDNKSVFYLMGVTLDYVDGPHGSGFVFEGLNNEHTCGCGG